ncbi:uncharacterized protein LOC116015107 [Ipomoea triloba]|uniref:uncharacterized protein LOC116015107 n=1 Tax=Ipomoea triloba TaxID=35885 RepID=UPI00125DFC65|nr:uncharacterized protein LOC116015107 [Ipomoea triloba]
MADASPSTQPQDGGTSIIDLDVDALVNCTFRLSMDFILQAKTIQKSHTIGMDLDNTLTNQPQNSATKIQPRVHENRIGQEQTTFPLGSSFKTRPFAAPSTPPFLLSNSLPFYYSF